MYKLKNVSLEGLGLEAGRQANSSLAISGFLDMPARLGTTSYSWARERGIEPYVSAEDIAVGGFAGRNINMISYIKGNDRSECDTKRLNYFNLIDSCTDLVPLESDWSTNNVYVNGPVVTEFIHDTLLKISTPFREPVCDLTGVIPPRDDSDFGIDGISFKSFGAILLEISGTRDRPAPKQGSSIASGKEGFQITKTVAPEIQLKLFIERPTYAEFKSKIMSLCKIFSMPGLRSITNYNDSARSFFVKDGFKVTGIYTQPGKITGLLEVTIIQTGVALQSGNLTIRGSVVTIGGQPIRIKI